MSDFTDSSDDEISTPETPSQTQTMSTNPTPQITRSNPSFASIIFILTLLLATYLLRLQPSKKEVTSYKPYNAGGYGRVISLELGEHYSRVAVIDNGVPVVILNELYEKQTPNYVQFWEDSVTVGEEAQWCASLWPKDHMAEYFIYGVRRLLGRKFSEDRTLTKDIDKLRYKVVGKDDKPIIEAKIGYTSRATLFSPEEITAEVVKRLKGDAETYLNTSITHCVLTLPSYFNDAQRQATRDAATLGGLETVRVLNEPVAAGIAYKLDRQKPKEGEFEVLSLVYDLGESCVDITLLSVELGVFEIMGSAHSRSYGGMDLDRVLERDFPEEVKDPITGLVILDGTWLDRALKKLRRHLDALPFAFPHRLPSGAFSMRSKSSMRWEELFEHSIPHLSNLLHSAKLEKSEITSLILTGTPSQTAKIRPFLEAFFNNKKVLGGIDPSEAVVMGAAIQAGILSGEGETSCDGWFMYDVSVLRLGVEMGNGVFEKVVARNTVIATRMARNFTTTVDGQTKLVIGIFEGERLMAEHNKLLETLELDNLKLGPAGGVTIEVAFEIDDNYHLMVTAREIGDGGASAKMAKAIDLSGRPGEVTDKIIADAEMHREEDEVRAKAAAEKLDGGERAVSLGLL